MTIERPERVLPVNRKSSLGNSLESKLDKRDWTILWQLQQNARISFAELARRVHLSAPAVAERVQKLEAAGVIQGYQAIVDAAKVGLPITALIQLEVTPKEYRKSQDKLHAIKEIVDCYHTTGNHCVFLKVCVRSVTHLDGLLEQLVQFGEPTTSLILSQPVRHRLLGRDG